MGIDIQAVKRHCRRIEFCDLVVFDDDLRKQAARRAWSFYARACANPYRMYDGATVDEWHRIVKLLADENPHWATELKAEAMRRIERTQ